MADRIEMLLEAERRGILPPDKLEMLNEARRRGLIGGEQAVAASNEVNQPEVQPIPQPEVQPQGAQGVANQASSFLEGVGTAGNEAIQQFQQFRQEGGLGGMMGQTQNLKDMSPRELAMGFAGPGAIKSVGALARPAFQFFSRMLKKPVPKAPTFEQLKKFSGEAYDIADEAGLTISNQSFGRSVQALGNKLTEAGIDPTLHPKATAAFKRLADGAAEELPLRKFETLRRVAKGAAASIDRDERRIAQIITEHLDDYLGGIGKSDVVAGDPVLASKALTRARSLWSRAKKGEQIEEMIERATERASQFSGSGLENALRTEFRQLALNPKRLRGFNKAEKAAIRRVGRGGPTVNALRMLGKFAPTGIVSSALSSGAGAVVGGAPGAIALPAVGFGARAGATALTQRNARRASELMRSGVSPRATPQTRAPASRGQGLVFGAIPGVDPFESR